MRTKNGFSCAFLMLWAVLRGHIGTNRGISAQMAGRYSRKEKSGKIGCTAVVQEGNIRKTMAARGLVNGRDPRSGRDLVFRCYPPKLLPPQKKTEADLFGVSLFVCGTKISLPSPLRGMPSGASPEHHLELAGSQRSPL